MASLLLWGCGSDARPPPPAPGAQLTAGLEQALDRKLREKVTGTGIPGASASVIFADGRQWSGAAGRAVLKPQQAMTVAHALPFDQVTTVVTGALALRLAEEGKLDLDEPVVRRYAAWRGAPDATVRDLLNHTSGLARPGAAFWRRLISERQPATDRQFLAATPDPGPRTRTPEYSDAGFILAGLILRRAAGEPVAAAARRRLLSAPGGTGLALQPDEQAQEPHAHSYWYPRDIRFPVDVSDGSGLLPSRAWALTAATAGGMAGDVPSLARWGRQLLGGRVLDPGSLREMTRFREGGPWDAYGLGLARSSHHERTMWGHSGDGLGSHTELWHLPRERVTVAISWNDDLIEGDGQILPALLDIALTPSP